VAALLANPVAEDLNGVVGIGYEAFTGEWISPNGLLLGVIGSILSAANVRVLWKFASILTRSLGIHSLTYGTPILQLAFLAFVGQMGDINAAYLIIGTAAIITSNLIINFEAEVQLGFEALILGLGSCGAIVYMRDHILDFIGVVNWRWNEGGYFHAVDLSDFDLQALTEVEG